MNRDVVPNFVMREALVRIVVSPITSNYRDFVSTLSKSAGEIGQVLCSRYDVRVKTLVEEKVLQKSALHFMLCTWHFEEPSTKYQALSSMLCSPPGDESLQLSFSSLQAMGSLDSNQVDSARG